MELNFQFSQQDAQIILNALTKEPYITVVDVVNKLQQQASGQMAPKEAGNN